MESELVRAEAPGHLPAAPVASWGRERVELIKRTICPKGISDDEFALFVEQCKRSGLDPLIKEAFCVPRNVKLSRKGEPDKWGTKHEFQPSEAGMLARAERFPDFKGIQASAVYAEDEIIVDQGKGEVVHRFNPAKRKGALVGAWARVVREGKLPVVVWLDFSGYVQQTPLWAKIPTTMIEKCARVAALRKGYPEAFGGLYVREEMPAEEYEAPASGGGYEAMGPPEALAGGDVAPAPEETLKPAQAIDLDKLMAMDRSRVPVAFGKKKGTLITDLSNQELTDVANEGAERLKGNESKRWAKAMQEQLLLLGSELEHRMANSERAEAKQNMRRDGGPEQ